MSLPQQPLPDRADIAIVGAGLAGLCAAARLTAAGRHAVVVEASDGVGGRVRTDEVDGFLLDRGFQILLTSYPEVQAQLDLDTLHLGRFQPGAAVQVDGRIRRVGDPLRSPKLLPDTARAPIGSLRDKARILALRRHVLSMDPRELLRQPDSSTSEHLRSFGFSDVMVDRFFRPLFAGIQLDPTLETSRRMFDVIFRSLATGDAAVPAGGMGAIPAQLAARLNPEQLVLNTEVVGVSSSGVQTAAGHLHADHVVVATDGPTAAKLIGTPHRGSQSVGSVWFSAPVSPHRDRLIVLDGDGRGPAMNLAVLSDVAPTYAPPGKALVVASCPGDLGHDLAGRVRRQCATWFGPSVHEWEELRTDRIVHAQPAQLPVFDPKQSVQMGDNLWVCGDHRDTGSIQGAMFSGRRTAEAIILGGV